MKQRNVLLSSNFIDTCIKEEQKVLLVLHLAQPVAQLARGLGIADHLLYRRGHATLYEGEKETDMCGPSTSERSKNGSRWRPSKAFPIRSSCASSFSVESRTETGLVTLRPRCLSVHVWGVEVTAGWMIDSTNVSIVHHPPEFHLFRQTRRGRITTAR